MTRSCFAYKTTALTLAIVLVMGFLPASLLAQEVEENTAGDALAQEVEENTAGDACARGMMDGENVDTGLWMAVGCALGLTGWLIAYVVEPSPPAANLIGKDSTYTMQYIDCYKRAAKAKQSKAALTGCCIGQGVFAVVYAVLLTVSASSDSGY